MATMEEGKAWPPGLFLHIPSMGCVYHRENSCIMGTPVNADGSISLDYDEWFLVDLTRGDEVDELIKVINSVQIGVSNV